MKTLKKINLKSVSERLSNKELKRILGGGGGEGGYATCGYRDAEGYSYCNLTQSEARFMAEGIPGYWWCCDSCKSNGGNASYC